MHELGVVIEVVKTVQRFAQQNHVTKIDKIVLQIGELSSMIPKYVQECYPAAIDGTEMAQTDLEIEIILAEGMCKQCRHIFPILENRSHCPECQSPEWGLLSGKEFLIKEIVAC